MATDGLVICRRTRSSRIINIGPDGSCGNDIERGGIQEFEVIARYRVQLDGVVAVGADQADGDKMVVMQRSEIRGHRPAGQVAVELV